MSTAELSPELAFLCSTEHTIDLQGLAFVAAAGTQMAAHRASNHLLTGVDAAALASKLSAHTAHTRGIAGRALQGRGGLGSWFFLLISAANGIVGSSELTGPGEPGGLGGSLPEPPAAFPRSSSSRRDSPAYVVRFFSTLVP